MNNQAMIDKNEITSGPLTEDQEIYKENIIDHYKYPHNKNEMEEFDVKNRELNPLCGDEITVFLKVDDNKITEVSWFGQGCAISQASISILSDELVGKSLDEVKEMTKEYILEMLGIPISYVRMKCALLSLKVVVKGIENVRD